MIDLGIIFGCILGFGLGSLFASFIGHLITSSSWFIRFMSWLHDGK